jgi:cation diffusion facilitator family transporter
MAEDSKFVVYGGLAANVGVAIAKFIAAGISGSSAMLSEGFHSLVDSGNGILLLTGMHRSMRKPDAEHPFGYGKELYFWSLLVAVMIFGVGGGVSAYQGILHVLRPRRLEDPKWSYIVLGLSALLEGASFVIAVRAFWKEKGNVPFWKALRTSKDPTTYSVMVEDCAALLGLLIAAIGIYLSHRFQRSDIDGIASIFIGVLLSLVAVFLIHQCRGLLVGEGIAPETAKGIRKIVSADDRVESVGFPLSMYVGPDDVLLVLDVQFKRNISAVDVSAAVDRLEQQIRDKYSRIKRIYIEAEAVGAASRLG